MLGRTVLHNVTEIYDTDFPWKLAKTMYKPPVFMVNSVAGGCHEQAKGTQVHAGATNKKQQWQWQLEHRARRKNAPNENHIKYIVHNVIAISMDFVVSLYVPSQNRYVCAHIELYSAKRNEQRERTSNKRESIEEERTKKN